MRPNKHQVQASEEMDEAAKLFGERLRRIREDKGIGLRELAARIPLSHTALGNYELGQRLPSAAALRQIATGLGVPYEQLEEALFEAQVQALLRANKRLSPSSRQQIMNFIRFAEAEDRKARDNARG